MSSPDLRAQLPALSAAGEAIAASGGAMDETGKAIALLPPAAVDAALPGSATSTAFRGAVRAWAVVSGGVADELRALGLRLGETGVGLASTDEDLAARLAEQGPR